MTILLTLVLIKVHFKYSTLIFPFLELFILFTPLCSTSLVVCAFYSTVVLFALYCF